MRISLEAVSARANELYGQRKGNPDREILSDQVKAMAQALVEAMNKGLFKPVILILE